jgi:hypothetical protein
MRYGARRRGAPAETYYDAANRAYFYNTRPGIAARRRQADHRARHCAAAWQFAALFAKRRPLVCSASPVTTSAGPQDDRQ